MERDAQAEVDSLDDFLEREHPGNRPAEPADPMETTAARVDGDPLIMLDCLIEEYAHQGASKREILDLFDQPFYQATHGLKRLLGEDAIRRRVESVLVRCGVFRVQTVTATDPDSDRPDADVLNIEDA
jgi:hypothetical protein